MERSESVEALQSRLEHFEDAEQVALRALEYARAQKAETERRIAIAKETGAFVINAEAFGIEDIGYGETG